MIALVCAFATPHARADDATIDIARRLADDSMGAMNSQGFQLRMRQQRLRQQRILPGQPNANALPTLANDLNYQPNARPAVPLRLRGDGANDGGLVVGTNIGRLNSFLTGNIYNDMREHDGGGAHSDAVTGGMDYRLRPDVVAGIATTGTHTWSSAGQSIATYVTVEPIETIFVDLNAGFGEHAPRRADRIADMMRPVTAATRALSISVSHMKQMGDWILSPYGRYDNLQTGLHVEDGQSTDLQQRVEQWSVGGLARAELSTPFGLLRPQFNFEMQRESKLRPALSIREENTRAVVGMQMQTRMARNISAFVDTRYSYQAHGDPFSMTTLGLRLTF